MRKLVMIMLVATMMMCGLSASAYYKGRKVKPEQLNEWFATNKENKTKMKCTLGKDSKLGEVFIVFDDLGNKYCISDDSNNDGIDPKIMEYWGKVKGKVRKE